MNKSNSFGQRIRDLRQERKQLQLHLAAEVGVKPWVLSKIERGLRRAKPELLAKFAKALYAERDELHLLWLADRIQDAIGNYRMGLEALDLAKEQLKDQINGEPKLP